MKNTLFFLSIFCLNISFAQTNEEIAGVYIKKADREFTSNNISDAEKHFNKAVILLDTIKNEEVDRLGTLINFRLGNLMVAQQYAKHYFKISSKKDSLKYEQQLELYVTIEEKLDSISKVNEAQRLAQIARNKELKRIDSLKMVWKKQANRLTLDIEKVLPFDKNGFAIYKKGDFYGILSDNGSIIIPADTYKDVKSFDGYTLLLDQKQNPYEILCFNAKTKESFKLPELNQFNKIATHFEHVSLPRGNGKLITYPNNSTKTLVYDLNTKSIEVQNYDKDFLKSLKKEDKISSYKEGLVKINKVWYYFGGAIAPGIYTLYQQETSKFYGYLFHFDGRVVAKDEFGYFGTLHKNKIQAKNKDQNIWLNTNVQSTEAPENESGNYSGKTKVLQLQNGKIQFKQDKIIILGDKTLDSLNDFLLNNNVAREDL